MPPKFHGKRPGVYAEMVQDHPGHYWLRLYEKAFDGAVLFIRSWEGDICDVEDVVARLLKNRTLRSSRDVVNVVGPLGLGGKTRVPTLKIEDTELDYWFERDRAYVGLTRKKDDKTLFELWDENVGAASSRTGFWRVTGERLTSWVGCIRLCGITPLTSVM